MEHLPVKLRRLDPEKELEWLDYHNQISERARAERVPSTPQTDEEEQNMMRDNEQFLKATRKEYDEVSSIFGNSRVLFAEVGRKPIGMIKYDLDPEYEIVEIEELNVTPAFRGMGIGFQLLEDVITEARMYDCQRITVIPQEGSIGFYDRMGFKGNDPEKPTQMWLDLNESYWTCDSDSTIQ
jgi:GNAT superfamily N-acetyltransferase